MLLLFCVLVASTATAVAGARAATRGAVFALQPLGNSRHAGYFVLDARPGTVLTRAVRVVNTGTAAGVVLLYPVDATTGQTTGAVYLARRAPRRDVGAWIHLAAGQLRVAPKQSRTVGFTITVPRTAAGGQHLGGMVAENALVTRGATHRRGRGSFRIDVRSLTIVAVQLNLPGAARERMTLTGVHPGGAAGRQMLLVSLRNDGNQLTRGQGQLMISDQQGRLVRQTRFPLDTFVPHTQVADPIAVPGRGLPAGTYQATVTIRYGHGHTARLRASFAISQRQIKQVFGSSPQPEPQNQSSGPPLLMLILGAVALVAVAFLAALFVLRRRMPPASATERPRQP